MAQVIRLANDFSLPIDAMTEAMALLATRKRGKTHTATLFAEELLRQRQQVVIMDPVGLYWGLRSSKDGRGEGYKILILGGSHADVPLHPADAATIAQFVVGEDASVVIDLSQFGSKGEQVRFCEVFFDRLWHLKQAHRTPMLLILEESQEFAPQRPREKEQVMLGRIERIAKLGRNYGIGLLLITQRPASLNKDVLDLIGILIVLGVVAAIERKVVREWMAGQSLGDHADLVDSLPGLQRGTGYLWWPEHGILKLLHFRDRETFNSSATPEVGQKRIEPGRRAEIDLDAFKEKLGALIEKAKADDPEQLKRRVKELERKLLNQQQLAPKVEVREKRVEVIPVGFVDILLEISSGVSHLVQLGREAETLMKPINRLGSMAVGMENKQKLDPEPPLPARTRIRKLDAATTIVHIPPPNGRSPLDGQIEGEGERRVMAVLAQFPQGRTHNELAFLANYSSKASTLGVYLARLRSKGLVEQGQPIRPTPAGLAAIGGAVETPKGDELLQHWLRHPRMGKGERAVLEVLMAAWPKTLTNDELSERTGYSPTASTQGVYLANLRKLGLVEPSRRRIPDEFMEAVRS